MAAVVNALRVGAQATAVAAAVDGATGAIEVDVPSEDYSHLFRSEGLVLDVDLRVDVAENFSRYVGGNEDIELDSDTILAGESVTITRGARTRHVGEYKRYTYWEEMLAIGERYTETVHGGVHQKALFAAEAIVGGAYTNTIAGPYLRLAGWVDFLAWGGWAEVDLIRSELSLLMIRSHVGYAHAAGVRMVGASRLVDDFWNRTENFTLFSDKTGAYNDTGAPGGGITNEA